MLVKWIYLLNCLLNWMTNLHNETCIANNRNDIQSVCFPFALKQTSLNWTVKFSRADFKPRPYTISAEKLKMARFSEEAGAWFYMMAYTFYGDAQKEYIYI